MDQQLSEYTFQLCPSSFLLVIYDQLLFEYSSLLTYSLKHSLLVGTSSCGFS